MVIQSDGPGADGGVVQQRDGAILFKPWNNQR
jgi:hypothetical protein